MAFGDNWELMSARGAESYSDEWRKSKKDKRIEELTEQVEALTREIKALREELAHQRRLTARLMPGQEDIETVCAWCGVHMSGPVGADREHTSHGICEKCLDVEFPEKVTA